MVRRMQAVVDAIEAEVRELVRRRVSLVAEPFSSYLRCVLSKLVQRPGRPQ
jgi:hypothetical protein